MFEFDLDSVLFIHVPKTGGTSVKDALKYYRYTDPSDNHKTAAEWEEYLGFDVFNSLLKLAIVRNPYDRMVSEYFYARSDPKHTRYYMCNYLSFSDFVHVICNHSPKTTISTQFHYISSGGKSALDYVLRFESLTENWDNFIAKFNSEIKLPHIHKVERPHWVTMYNEYTRFLVYREYIIDFKEFQYKEMLP